MIQKKIIFFYLIFIYNTYTISSLNLTTSFNIGNLGFSSDMNESSQGVIWGTSIIAEEKLNEIYYFSGGVVFDDVSGNRIESLLSYNSKYIELGMGPTLASINNSQLQLKPGIKGLLTVKKVGKFDLTTEIYSTLGNLSDSESDYSQLETSLELAINIPGAICTFIISNRQFTQFSTDSSSLVSKTSDSYSTYALEADIYKKNIPFHLFLTLGYKSVKRVFPTNDSEGRELAGIGSIFIGMGTRVSIGKRMLLNASIDSGLYNFSLNDEATITDLPAYLFDSSLSFTYRF